MKKIALASLLTIPAFSGSSAQADEKGDDYIRFGAQLSEKIMFVNPNRAIYDGFNSVYGENMASWGMPWKDFKPRSLIYLSGAEISAGVNGWNVFAGYGTSFQVLNSQRNSGPFQDPGYGSALNDLSSTEHSDYRIYSMGLKREWKIIKRFSGSIKGSADYWETSSSIDLKRIQGPKKNPSASVLDENIAYKGSGMGWTIGGAFEYEFIPKYHVSAGASFEYSIAKINAIGKRRIRTNAGVDSESSLSTPIDLSGGEVGFFFRKRIF